MDKKKRRLMMRTVILVLLGAALVYALYTNFTKDTANQIQMGSEAPNFVLTDMDGNEHKLSDYRGQGVLLNFWGTWCKPCEYEMPYMENQYHAYKDQGVQILAVNVGESNYAVNNFVSRHNLSFPVMIDKGQEVQVAYRVDPLPVTFLIDKEGKVIDRITGSLTEAKIQQHMERIKP
ncbi:MULTISPECIES: thiol-disulfide oxidoreductase ResA [Peribacillus]|uniref:Thiol-disulfide oxidoreductase n=1 Tax=Peribacillus asahii TaxID=228899 RepID=A0A3Q9RQ57_9BACI|nr:thiol-disulfide oxidoreductase ResA [Peribacillus asahii]AZV44182.1 thiol-disulfide oxidoreductase [Peribacillus asahii]USK83897.1 thiol-disulfide oxidoreductase ResA [Peribacillus asahii]